MNGLSFPVNPYYNFFYEFKKLEERVNLLEEKLNNLEKEKNNNYLKKDDNYYMI